MLSNWIPLKIALFLWVIGCVSAFTETKKLFIYGKPMAEWKAETAQLLTINHYMQQSVQLNPRLPCYLRQYIYMVSLIWSEQAGRFIQPHWTAFDQWYVVFYWSNCPGVRGWHMLLPVYPSVHWSHHRADTSIGPLSFSPHTAVISQLSLLWYSSWILQIDMNRASGNAGKYHSARLTQNPQQAVLVRLYVT